MLNKVISAFQTHYGNGLSIYEKSLREKDGNYFFMVKGNERKKLVVLGNGTLTREFDGEQEKLAVNDKTFSVKISDLNHKHLSLLKKIFPDLNPSFCGKKPSFGTGDRLGITTAAHIRAIDRSGIFPFLAQQSARENNRTGRSWRNVLDDAIWGVFESGYKGAFGADADHIKGIEDLEKAIEEGYSMFTIDPSDYVRNPSQLSEKEKNEIYSKFPNRATIEKLYLGKIYQVEGKEFSFDEKSLRDATVVYLEAIDYAEKLYKFLKKKKKDEFDFEISIDETATPTSPIFHIFVASELTRRGVQIQNLALRFVGDWQKGIDYIGNVRTFEKELAIHVAISKLFDGYKLSLHSGSDKFSVYPAFGRITEGLFHVKTAGTSYLEAVKVIAQYDPKLYREIHKFALKNFDRDRSSYHLTTDLSNIPDIDEMEDNELTTLFENPNVRQLLHVTYGTVLNAKDAAGNFLFRDRFYRKLFEREKEYYEAIEKHIRKHINLLLTV